MCDSRIVSLLQQTRSISWLGPVSDHTISWDYLEHCSLGLPGTLQCDIVHCDQQLCQGMCDSRIVSLLQQTRSISWLSPVSDHTISWDYQEHCSVR
ncbi:hypothetical protein J6590_081040 [Homalodisca vitripennis]|nr:hypothetical protein J6590_081040 [Homalodisca vitripennis]